MDPGTRATRTIKEYAPFFLRHHQVEGNTKDTDADTLRLHVIPFLGGCRLAETDRTMARNYITALQEEGRSANTIRQAKVVLGAMFGMAVADGYLDYNPFHDVKIPKVPGRRAIKVATPEQFLKVRACLPTKPAQVFSTLLVSSGLRFCEAVGLLPSDFDSGEVRRRWEKSRDADEDYLDEPIWNRIWARAVAESGIPFKPTAYQVRHTHASWLIDAGENPKAVMHRLGQADLRTTARYVHVFDETGESAARRFEGLLPPL